MLLKDVKKEMKTPLHVQLKLCVSFFGCCDAHLLNMLKITIIILIELFCLILKYMIFTFTDSSFDF